MTVPVAPAFFEFPHDQRTEYHDIPSESVVSTMWAPPVFVDLPAACITTLEGTDVGLHNFGLPSTALLHPLDWGHPPMLISITAALLLALLKMLIVSALSLQILILPLDQGDSLRAHLQ